MLGPLKLYPRPQFAWCAADDNQVAAQLWCGWLDELA